MCAMPKLHILQCTVILGSEVILCMVHVDVSADNYIDCQADNTKYIALE